MANDNLNGADVFDSQQVFTPDIKSLQTKGTGKLLVVIFLVDCSQTMAGGRIQAVNAALRELKFKLQEIRDDNGLEMKVAIMTFTSNARWDLKLTDIDEVIMENLTTRPGLTEYGNAFHELNKVLQNDQFMKHTGKTAPPAIMFLTDGEPTDDYEADLNELLANRWFNQASRSAVLLGEAIENDLARAAVSRFVEDPDQDIVSADKSTVIIQKIKLATMHTVAGDPIPPDPNEGGKKPGGFPFPDDPDDPDDPDIPDLPPIPDPFPDDPDDPDSPGDFPPDLPFPDDPVNINDLFPDDPSDLDDDPSDLDDDPF